MLHILLGTATDDAMLLLDKAKSSNPINWIVPKKARIGDATLFYVHSRGFLARGVIDCKPQASKRWPGRYTATVRSVTILPAAVPLAFVRDNYQEWAWPTYPRMYTSIAGTVESRLNELLDGYHGPTGGTAPPSTGPFVEGTSRSVLVTAYERNPIARQQCIEHYGSHCFACGFSFGETYGETADGYIHVHHLKTVADRGGEYEVDPVKDLRPMCPNCHAVIHLRSPHLSLTELKKMLRHNQKRGSQ